MPQINIPWMENDHPGHKNQVTVCLQKPDMSLETIAVVHSLNLADAILPVVKEYVEAFETESLGPDEPRSKVILL